MDILLIPFSRLAFDRELIMLSQCTKVNNYFAFFKNKYSHHLLTSLRFARNIRKLQQRMRGMIDKVASLIDSFLDSHSLALIIALGLTALFFFYLGFGWGR